MAITSPRTSWRSCVSSADARGPTGHDLQISGGEHGTPTEGPWTYDFAVIGLGYVGLPLAMEATLGGELTGFGLDVSSETVDALNRGVSRVDDVSSETVAQAISQGFFATTDPALLAQARTILICVPTPLSEEGGPDLGAVLASTETIAQHASPGALVVLESTTWPGTTEEVLAPLFLEHGYTVGTDLCLGFSPERIDPGNPTYGLRNTPKVVSGVTPTCATRVEEFYSQFVEEVVVAAGTREAEMAKLLENTYRQINIALVNEMAQVLPRPWHRHLGGHPLCLHQALRVRSFLARCRGRGTLHPHRPQLSLPPSPVAARLSLPVRRTGSGDQPFDAALPRPARTTPSQRPRAARQRVPRRHPRRDLQARHRRSTGVPCRPVGPRAAPIWVPTSGTSTRLSLRWQVDAGMLDKADSPQALLDTCDLVLHLQPSATYPNELLASSATPVLDATGRLHGPNVFRL